MGGRSREGAARLADNDGDENRKRLTESAIARAVGEAKRTGSRRELIDAGCEGLRIRVSPTGLRAYSLVCRDRFGAVRRFPIGSYPEMRISDARDEARRLRLKVRDEGHDPTAARKRDRQIGADARAGIGTLKAVLDIYENKRGSQLKSWAEGRRQIERVFKPLLEKPAATLKADHLQAEADAYQAKHSASLAVRTLRPALKWLAMHGKYVPADLAVLHPPATVTRRKRVLDHAELARLLPVLRASHTSHALLLRFLLLTLARLEEGAKATWRYVDLDKSTWTIPTTKNGEPHEVPLSTQAVALLASLTPEKPDPDALVFQNNSGRALGNWDRACKAFMKASETTGWNRHDLRRTAATLLGRMGEAPHIIEAALNHASIHSRLAALYNTSRYRPEVAAALQRLADLLDKIEAGENATETGCNKAA